MDRNGLGFCYHCDDVPSLSARRAWIEIQANATGAETAHVALRKESVDRNKIGIASIDSISRSLSARRAWIEI